MKGVGFMPYSKYGIICMQSLYQDKSGEVHNEYHFQTETGIYLGWLRFPYDRQFTYDARMIDGHMKALAIRYGFIKTKQRS